MRGVPVSFDHHPDVYDPDSGIYGAYSNYSDRKTNMYGEGGKGGGGMLPGVHTGLTSPTSSRVAPCPCIFFYVIAPHSLLQGFIDIILVIMHIANVILLGDKSRVIAPPSTNNEEVFPLMILTSNLTICCDCSQQGVPSLELKAFSSSQVCILYLLCMTPFTHSMTLSLPFRILNRSQLLQMSSHL